MTAKLITPPSIEPITVEEAKIFLRIDSDEEDELLSSLISAARLYAEKYTARSFITQTWEIKTNVIANKLYLPYPPVQRIDSITVNGEALPDNRYALLPEDILYVITPVYTTKADGVAITYTAGYGNTAQDVPRDIRQAILITVAGLYENRESGGVSAEAKELLKPYRVFQL